MKRYLYFAWSDYYPTGGFNDLLGSDDEDPSFENLDAVLNKLCKESGLRIGDYDRLQIVDSQTMKILLEMGI
jgi:hypothetical protein